MGSLGLNPEQLGEKEAGQVPACEWPHERAEYDQKSISQPTDITEPCEQIVRLSVQLLNLHVQIDFEAREFVEALRIVRRMERPSAGLELRLLEHDKIACVLLP